MSSITPPFEHSNTDGMLQNAVSHHDARAWLASLGLHLLLLTLLAILSFTLPKTSEELELAYEPPESVEEVEPLPEEFLSSDEPMDEIGALSQSGSASAIAAALVLDERSLVVFEPEPVTDLGEREVIELDAEFRGPELTQDLSVQGVAHVGTTGAVGAIDRLTHEILLSVEQQPTLVVWLFDQSGSLRDERERIRRRFRDIYEQLGVIEASQNPAFKQHRDKPLLTAVAAFGDVPQLLTPKPTDQLAEIEAAVAAIEGSQSPTENVFQAVAMTAEKFRAYRLPRHGSRNVMIIVFTDESGDDVAQLDETVHLCRKLAMPVYVVGRPAPFGRSEAYVKWIDPDPNFDQRPQWVPVNLGPESLMPERLKLRFLNSRRRETLADSGFGPFALTRLCYETGGLYFSAHPNRAVGRSVNERETSELAAHFTQFFDPDVMRRYEPNYLATDEYLRTLTANQAMQAVVEAAQLSLSIPRVRVERYFSQQDDAALVRGLSEAQRAAAIMQPAVDRICQLLLAAESDRHKIKSPRWQANYDLALGTALATQVRTAGYNMMLASAKQGMAFQDEKNNAWVLNYADNFSSSRLEKIADRAQSVLTQVVKEHPETPWAWAAKRELRLPLGWKWDEYYHAAERTGRPSPRPPRRDPPPL